MKTSRRGFFGVLGAAVAVGVGLIEFNPARKTRCLFVPYEDIDDDVYGVIHRFLPGTGGGFAPAFSAHQERLLSLWREV